MSAGIVRDNSRLRRTGSLINTNDMRKIYLNGLDLRYDDGSELEDEVIQRFIDEAYSAVETYLDIYIAATLFSGPAFDREGNPLNGNCEVLDYEQSQYTQFGSLDLSYTPVIRVFEVRLVYPTFNTIITFPPSWFRIQKLSGRLNMFPMKGTYHQVLTSIGSLYPRLLSFMDRVPQAWEVDYVAGFEDGYIPKNVNRAVGLTAGIGIMNMLGNRVIGAGIASESISIDGISRTIDTTSSAENHAYSAPVKEYWKELYGKEKVPGLLPLLRQKYQGSKINWI